MITGAEAQPLIEGRLGRPMLDELEAAVVLEAFGGLEADSALDIGREAAGFRSRLAADSVRTRSESPFQSPSGESNLEWRSILSDVSFIAGVLAIGLWLSRQISTLGVDVVDRSWRLALPVSLGAQWFLRRRVLVGPEGLGRLRRESWLLGPAAVAVGGLAFVSTGGFVAALLAATWISGFLVSRRGWGLPYCGGVVSLLLVAKWLPTWAVLATVVAASLTLASVALVSSPMSGRMSGSFARSMPSGLIGIALALILISEPRIAWGASTVLASLTIVPALLGAVIGGVWMTRIWTEVPKSLARTSSHGRVPFAPTLVFFQAVAMSLSVVAVISIVVLFVVGQNNATEMINTARVLLVAHGALAVAGLCVSSLEAFGRWGVGLVGSVFGAAASFLIGSVIDGAVAPGVRILAGSTVAIAVTIPVLLMSLRRPAQRIAISI
jgi:hypothetical protein